MSGIQTSGAGANYLQTAPVIRVLHGNPTPQETAAVVVVVAASAAAAAAASVETPGTSVTPNGALIVSQWNAPSRMVRRRFTLRNRPGPRAWVYSGRA